MYKITARQRLKAQLYGVKIKPSTNKKKKIDVFDMSGNKIAEIGAAGYMDYEMYIKAKGKEYADERRKLYKIRHANNRNKIGTPGFFADRILW
jgi:hypothetical protein